MTQNVLEVRDLTFSFDHALVLEEINFSLETGDYLWVIGPNGSGKTTLVKVILNILRREKGEIYLFDKENDEFREWSRVSYVPQSIALFDPYFPASAMEVAAMGLLSEKRYPKRLSKSDRGRVEEAFLRVGINNIKNRRIGELSGGQLQRVLLARALMTEPDILFLDEPTAAVEPGVREGFFGIVDDLNAKGATIVLINHDISGIGINSNKILYINRSQIFFGSGRDFCLSPDMGNYFGSSQHIICHQHLEDTGEGSL